MNCWVPWFSFHFLVLRDVSAEKSLKTTELTHTFGGGNTVLKYNNELLSSMIFFPFSCFTWCFSWEIAAWLKCWMILLCKLKNIGHGGQVYRYFFVTRKPFPIEYKEILCKTFVVNLIISSSFIVVVIWFLFYFISSTGSSCWSYRSTRNLGNRTWSVCIHSWNKGGKLLLNRDTFRCV